MKYQLTDLNIEKVDFDESTTIFRVTCQLKIYEREILDKLCFQFTPAQLKKIKEQTNLDMEYLATDGIISEAASKIFDLNYYNIKDPVDSLKVFDTIKTELRNDNKELIKEIAEKINKIIEDAPDYIVPRDYDSLKYKSEQYNKISKFLDDENVPKGDDKNGDYNLLKRLGILFHKNVTTNGIQDAKLEYNTYDVILIVDDHGNFTPILITGICYSGLGNIATHKWLCYETYIEDKKVHIPYDSDKIVGYIGNVEDLIKEYKDNCYWKEPNDEETK